jgi:DNA ligase 1
MKNFKPNLAESTEKEIKFPKLASPKLDGIRVVTCEGRAMTRSLKDVPNKHIRATLLPYQNLDGEIIVGPWNAPDVYRVTNSAVMSHEGQPEFVFYVFDELSDLSLPFTKRYEALQRRDLPAFIRILTQERIVDSDSLANYYNSNIENGFEGAILRNESAMYKFGRSTEASQDMLKMKPFQDSDARILGVYEAFENTNHAFVNELGYTERSTAMSGLEEKGMIGGFYVRDVATGVEFKCAPGTLTHYERVEIWNNSFNYKGKFLKYRHMPFGVKDLPRFPRFIGWRDANDLAI